MRERIKTTKSQLRRPNLDRKAGYGYAPARSAREGVVLLGWHRRCFERI
jgi:hypothetical protein